MDSRPGTSVSRFTMDIIRVVVCFLKFRLLLGKNDKLLPLWDDITKTFIFRISLGLRFGVWGLGFRVLVRLTGMPSNDRAAQPPSRRSLENAHTKKIGFRVPLR